MVPSLLFNSPLKYHLAALVISTARSTAVFAQSLQPIQLDRPDQTECPFITPKGYIQAENGLGCENVVVGQSKLTYPTSLWKYGVNKQCEVRLITELVTENNSSGIKPITVGIKASLIEETGPIPKISVIGHITSASLGSKDFRTSFIAPSFRFTMQHTISERVSLAYNLGAEWNGESARPAYIYTLSTGMSSATKLACYGEVYGFWESGAKADNRADAGLTYLVNNNVMLDLSAGFGLQSEILRNYLAIGFFLTDASHCTKVDVINRYLRCLFYFIQQILYFFGFIF
jgi:hypothetical protein